jgi:hypothetical protein
LKSGENVVVLFATNEISGFVPAIISKIQSVLDERFLDMEKIWYPIIHQNGYVLTQFQLGYLSGLEEARDIFK